MFNALRKLNLREFAGKHLKVSKLYTSLQGVLALEEIKQIKEFLSSRKEADGAEDSAFDLDNGEYIDMDELIEAIRLQ